jgi:membrane protease subunit HflC
MEESGYGIKIVDVRIRRTDLPEANKESVYNRMISDRQSIAARYLSEGDEESRKITSSADREAKVLVAQAEAEAKRIIAEGEQEAARIYNEAYGKDPEFYQFYRTLQSYVTTLQGEPVIMLPIDSPYARILLGQE